MTWRRLKCGDRGTVRIDKLSGVPGGNCGCCCSYLDCYIVIESEVLVICVLPIQCDSRTKGGIDDSEGG